MNVPPELLERGPALATLAECLADVKRTGHGRIVLIGGEAGVGKTALLRRFRDEQRRTVRTLWGASDPLFTPRPLGPLLDVADDVGGELALVVHSQAMPHEVVAVLTRELRSRPATVLVLEDVHWADEATLDLVRLLARRLDALPALVLVSYRNDELDRGHPLRQVLGELATRDGVQRLKLEALSRAAVGTLSAARGVDVDVLYQRTGGNPFFVVEALAAGAEEIPETVRDAVLARFARLRSEAQTLVEAVAVLPEEAEVWLLRALVGDAVDCLDECLASGMLARSQRGVAFRHELARLAIEESVAPNRRVDLHTRAVAALADPPGGSQDLARLAHHADAAGDADAVLRYAPSAAARAASLGAHREAAAQYARALRFADRLSPLQRAELLESRARACYLTDQYDAGIAALGGALDCRRQASDRRGEGDVMRQLSEFLWCPGRASEAARSARAAVTLLEGLPPGRELAWAYANYAQTLASAALGEQAIVWATRALRLAEELGETAAAVHALATIGVCQFDAGGEAQIEHSRQRALAAGLAEHVGRAYVLLAGPSVERFAHARARRYVEDGLNYCSGRGVELFRLYLLAFKARIELNEGRWTEAASTAATVLRIHRTSTAPRIHALVILGLVRARRGDPEWRAPLHEAAQLGEQTGELGRRWPAALAGAETAWLEGDHDGVAAAVADLLPLAAEHKWSWLVGGLLVWRRRAGLDVASALEDPPEPYSIELRGESRQAARAWAELGCPYESALALGLSDDEALMRQALDELRDLHAGPAAAIVAQRLRARGARSLPRGPRRATRDNPTGLTPRELDVLELVAQGLRDGEIAERLSLSNRTVGHHVSAILAKLNVRSRTEATQQAARLGVFDSISARS